MFPLLPILILLLMGPANADRLAVEGRLPAGLLAVHLARVAPVRAMVVAPVEEALSGTAGDPPAETLPNPFPLPTLPPDRPSDALIDACPPRAGPGAA